MGLKVTAPGTPHLKRPFAAELLLKLSTKAVLKVVEEGLFLEGNQTLREVFRELSPQVRMSQGSLLEYVQLKVRESGVSQRKIARQFGIAQQSVNTFLHSDNVNTKTLEMYARVFAPSLYSGLQTNPDPAADQEEP